MEFHRGREMSPGRGVQAEPWSLAMLMDLEGKSAVESSFECLSLESAKIEFD